MAWFRMLNTVPNVGRRYIYAMTAAKSYWNGSLTALALCARPVLRWEETKMKTFGEWMAEDRIAWHYSLGRLDHRSGTPFAFSCGNKCNRTPEEIAAVQRGWKDASREKRSLAAKRRYKGGKHENI